MGLIVFKSSINTGIERGNSEASLTVPLILIVVVVPGGSIS